MRVMLTVSNWPGHWMGMVPLCWALRSAGHEVRVLCTEEQAEPLNRAGLTPVPVLESWTMVFAGRLQNYLNVRDGLWPHAELPPHPLTGEPLRELGDFDLGAWFREHSPAAEAAARRSTEAAVAFGRAWRPDLVLHDLVSIEGLLVPLVLGVPAAVHLWGPTGTDEHEAGLDLVPTDLSKSFARHGLGKAGFEGVRHVIDPCPDPVAPPLLAGQERLPVRYIPYNGPGTLSTALPAKGERPRVCVVWGTSVSSMYGPSSFVVPDILAALDALGAEVLLTVTGEDRRRLGRLPDHVTLLEQAPLHLLLPGCDLVVHHGGAGCTMTAIDAGVPQLAVAFGLDQSTNGRRIAATGAGAVVAGEHADAATLREAAGALLATPDAARAAAALRDAHLARPTPAALVAELERLARSGAPVTA